MPKFEVIVPIEGTATYEIEAPSADEARSLVQDGEGKETAEWDFAGAVSFNEELIEVREVK